MRARTACGWLLGLAGALGVDAVQATNGFNLIGYASESVAVGGADVALVRDTSALAVNPAGLVHVENRRFDLEVEPFYLELGHSDSQGNDSTSDPLVSAFLNGGYAQRLSPSVVAGAGLYVAGGIGFLYKDLESGYGPRGDIEARFGVFRLAPGIGWQISDRLSIGATLGLNYATAKQKVFPNASVLTPLQLDNSLIGVRVDGLSAFGFNGIVGAKFAVSPTLILGLSYRSPTRLDLDGGTLTANYELFAAGRVTYQDASISGISLPQDVQAGLLFSPAPRWMLLAELDWIVWSRAIGDVTVRAAEPDRNPNPLLIPSTIENAQPLQFNDQYVIALGASHQWSEATALRAGINYARQPVPKQNLTPLFAVIPEFHFTAGVSQQLSQQWDLSAGVQYIPRVEIRYSNPSMRISEQATETHESFFLNITLSRSW